MKIVEFVIEPRSGFGTPLLGDTLFGQFCWQLIFGAGNASVLEGLLDDYERKPFLIFSDAFPRFGSNTDVRRAFGRPALPLSLLFHTNAGMSDIERIKRRKELKIRKWMLLDSTFLAGGLSSELYVKDSELLPLIDNASKAEAGQNFVMGFEQTRNTVNRLTGTTGEGGFAPYVVCYDAYVPGSRLSVFAGIDTDRISPAIVADGLRQIGLSGFGRDATVGLGKFDVADYGDSDFGDEENANACYTLSPSVPGNTWQQAFFQSFVRFGRHGGALAHSGHPFKAPVIMASSGSVFISSSGLPARPYIGRAVPTISKAEPNTYCQGYALYIPFRMEVR